MRAIIDTHALIWFLEGNKKLGKKAHEVLSSSSSELLLPVVVLCEFYYYLRKKKNSNRYSAIYQSLAEDPRISVRNIDASLIPHIPADLELHDGLIAALLMQENLETVILSKDSQLRQWNSSRLLWD